MQLASGGTEGRRGESYFPTFVIFLTSTSIYLWWLELLIFLFLCFLIVFERSFTGPVVFASWDNCWVIFKYDFFEILLAFLCDLFPYFYTCFLIVGSWFRILLLLFMATILRGGLYYELSVCLLGSSFMKCWQKREGVDRSFSGLQFLCFFFFKFQLHNWRCWYNQDQRKWKWNFKPNKNEKRILKLFVFFFFKSEHFQRIIRTRGSWEKMQFVASICSWDLILLFHMWFRIRILSRFHWTP